MLYMFLYLYFKDCDVKRFVTFLTKFAMLLSERQFLLNSCTPENNKIEDNLYERKTTIFSKYNTLLLQRATNFPRNDRFNSLCVAGRSRSNYTESSDLLGTASRHEKNNGTVELARPGRGYTMYDG